MARVVLLSQYVAPLLWARCYLHGALVQKVLPAASFCWSPDQVQMVRLCWASTSPYDLPGQEADEAVG